MPALPTTGRRYRAAGSARNRAAGIASTNALIERLRRRSAAQKRFVSPMPPISCAPLAALRTQSELLQRLPEGCRGVIMPSAHAGGHRTPRQPSREPVAGAGPRQSRHDGVRQPVLLNALCESVARDVLPQPSNAKSTSLSNRHPPEDRRYGRCHAARRAGPQSG